MSTTEILDVSVRIYRLLGWSMLKITLVPTILCLAAWVFGTTYVLPLLVSTQNANNVNAQIGEAAMSFGLLFLVGFPLFLIGLSISTCLISQLTSDYMIGNVPSPEAAWRAVRRSMKSVFLVTLREFGLALSGAIAASILLLMSGLISQGPGQADLVAAITLLAGIIGYGVGTLIFLWVVSIHAITTPIAVLEGLRPGEASKRSKMLLKPVVGLHPSGSNAVWNLYALMFFLVLVIGVGLGSVIGQTGVLDFLTTEFANVPFAGILIKAIGMIPDFLMLWIVIPVWATTITIIYYERRIRLEGYDIEALAGDVWRSDRQSRFQL